ncbi:MAG: hypothetical protein LPJ98_05125, partial [Cyclobacteriaceae bacterium]|nr:hypothetical protein [Cyclobacteriaceae bacterium]
MKLLRKEINNIIGLSSFGPAVKGFILFYCLGYWQYAYSQSTVTDEIRPLENIHIKLEHKGMPEDSLATLVLHSGSLDIRSRFPRPSSFDNILKPGSFLSADPGKWSADWEIRPVDQYTYLDIYLGKKKVIDNYIVTHGDSIWIHLDNEPYFLGPQGNRFELQYLLDREIKKTGIVTNPLMILSDVSRFLDTREKSESYQRLQGNYIFGWNRKLSFAENGQSRFDRVTELLETRSLLLDIEAVIKRFRDQIDPEFLSILHTEATAKSLIPSLTFLNTHVSPSLMDFEAFNLELKGLVFNPSNQVSFSSDTYLETVLLFVLWESKSKSISIDPIMSAFPWDFQDRLRAKYLLSNRNRLDPSVYRAQIPKIKDLQTRAYLRDLFLDNSESLGLAQFNNLAGESFSLDNYGGKFLLLDFWISSCGACVQFKEKVLPDIFRLKSEGYPLEVISVSADAGHETWKKTLETRDYLSLDMENFYAGKNEPFMEYHLIRSF